MSSISVHLRSLDQIVFIPIAMHLGLTSCCCFFYLRTAGKINIEHVTIFNSKYISKGAVDMKVSIALFGR